MSFFKKLASFALVAAVLLGYQPADSAQYTRFSAPFSGARLEGLTRSTTIAEYDGTIDASGNLVDKSGSNIITYSEDFTSPNWTHEGGATVVANQIMSPVSTLTADLVTVTNAAGIYNRSIQTAGTVWEPSIWIKRSSTSGTLRIQNPEGYVSGYFDVNLASLPDTWVKLQKGSPYVTWGADFVPAGGGPRVGLYFLRSGAGTISFYAWGAQLNNATAYRPGPGVYHYTNGAAKPALDLAPTATPTTSDSYLQGADGNRLRARTFNGSSQYYSKAHDASMNVFDTDHTITFVFKANSTGAGTEDVLFSHGASNVDGLIVEVADTNYVGFCYYKAAANVCQYNATSVRDNRWHVGQIVRRSDIASLFVDGVKVGSVSASTYGIDGSRTMYSAAYTGGLITFDGDILYTRIDAEALSDIQLAKERQLFQGVLGGTNFSAEMDFRRAGTAFQTYGDGTMSLRSAGMPRVGDGVLVEGALNGLTAGAGNIFAAASQRNVDSTWTKHNVTSSLNTTTGPDGTAYLDTLFETVANGYHGIYVNKTLTNATTFCMSAIVQPIGGRSHVALVYNLAGSPQTATWDLVTGFNTRRNAAWTTVGSQWLANGNLRIWGTVVGDGTSKDIGVYAANHKDNDPSYVGVITMGIAVGDMVLEQGAFPSSIPDASTGTRLADDISIPPYNLRNTLSDVIPGVTPTMAIDFDQDPSGSTITSTIGGYALTKAGQPKRYQSATYGSYHLFDGSTDYYTRADTGAGDVFRPAGDFSVSAVFTPTTLSGDHGIIGKYLIAGNKMGWVLFQSEAGLLCRRTTDGTAGTLLSISKPSCLVANKPTLVTVTYSTTAGFALYVDALPAATQAGTGVVFGSDTDLRIADYNNANKFPGRLHYLAYYNGTALSQANHNSLYAALKVPGILPTEIAHSTHYTKLRIRGEYKHEGLANVGTSNVPFLVDIGGNVSSGSTDSNTNRVAIYEYSNLLYAAIFANGEDTIRYMTKSSVTHNQWNSFDVVFDLSNLANSTGLLNNAAMTLDASMTGSDKHVYFLDTDIRVGKDYNNTAANYANSFIRNLVIEPLP